MQVSRHTYNETYVLNGRDGSYSSDDGSTSEYFGRFRFG